MQQERLEDRDAMSFAELLSWQWRETSPGHRNGTNLLIHIFAVPLFVLAHVLLVASPLIAGVWLAVAGVAGIVLSVMLQGFGHSLERVKSHPFTGPRDFVRRFYAEQFCNFWRFLFSGQWYANLRAGGSNG